MRVGAIVFDQNCNVVASDRTIINIDSAWASFEGGQARKINSIHELPSDVIWLTNLNYSNFYKAGLNKHPNFRNESWLRTLFNQIASELGVEASRVGPGNTASVLSSLASRVVAESKSRYKIETKAKKLNEDFATVLRLSKSCIPDEYYRYFDVIAEHPMVSVIHASNYASQMPTLTVKRNRLLHARRVLETLVPCDTAWEIAKITGSKSDNWLDNLDTPFLVKCAITNIKPLFQEILSWGSGSKFSREWLTDIEWRHIRKFADVTVSSALVCTEKATLLPVKNTLPSGSLDELSITLGLIAEQIWTSVTNKQHYRVDATRYTAAAAWIRAKDRIEMFDFAQRLHARGLNVMSYGVGNVVMRYPEAALKRYIDISLEMDLLPPAGKMLDATIFEKSMR